MAATWIMHATLSSPPVNLVDDEAKITSSESPIVHPDVDRNGTKSVTDVSPNRLLAYHSRDQSVRGELGSDRAQDERHEQVHTDTRQAIAIASADQ